MRGSDPRVGPLGPYNENALNLILEDLILYSHTKLKKKSKYIVMMSIKIFILIVKSMAIQVIEGGGYDHIVKLHYVFFIKISLLLQ